MTDETAPQETANTDNTPEAAARVVTEAPRTGIGAFFETPIWDRGHRTPTLNADQIRQMEREFIGQPDTPETRNRMTATLRDTLETTNRFVFDRNVAITRDEDVPFGRHTDRVARHTTPGTEQEAGIGEVDEREGDNSSPPRDISHKPLCKSLKVPVTGDDLEDSIIEASRRMDFLEKYALMCLTKNVEVNFEEASDAFNEIISIGKNQVSE